MQLLRDNLTLWTSDMEDGNDKKEEAEAKAEEPAAPDAGAVQASGENQ